MLRFTQAARAAALAFVLVPACVGDSDGASATEPTSSDGLESTASSGAQSPAGGVAESSGGVSPPMRDDASGGSGPPDLPRPAQPPELGVCATLIDCAASLDEPIHELVATFGENGSCWELDDPHVCWSDCSVGLQERGGGYDGQEPQCQECVRDEDCAFWPQRPRCDPFLHECEPPLPDGPAAGYCELYFRCCEKGFGVSCDAAMLFYLGESLFECVEQATQPGGECGDALGEHYACVEALSSCNRLEPWFWNLICAGPLCPAPTGGPCQSQLEAVQRACG